MKLNYKRTFFVGFAFMSISAFWMLYDGTVPLILRDTFSLRDDVAGLIMALDNILALFMLPLFGTLSDKCRSRLGRRTPYIIAGTLAACLFTVALPFADKAGSLLAFFIILGLLLIAMGTYRSPAVALMPDVTPPPLRSKANAIINLMGAVGGVYTLIMTKLLVHTPEVGFPDYTWLYVSVAALMLLAVILLVITVRERKLADEMRAAYPEVDDTKEKQAEVPAQPLPKAVKVSLVLILMSVALWYMGYNAVTTAFTKYATQEWGMELGDASFCLMIATGGAIASYIPVGIISSKIGRKKMILIGVVLLAAAFGLATLFKTVSFLAYVLFAVVGFAWAAINVNSYPMVVEIGKVSNTGKYTGYYYTFSMAAQIATPILSGILLENVGYWTLFPYAAIMVALAFITMAFTRHGDSKPAKAKVSLEALDVED